MDTQLDKLKKRIIYNSLIFESEEQYEYILNCLLEDSLAIAISILFPFDSNNIILPPQYYNWQIRCCIELYNLADKQGMTSYSENGLSFSKYTDGISLQLIDELIPMIYVPN